jgi:hypothetical protein
MRRIANFWRDMGRPLLVYVSPDTEWHVASNRKGQTSIPDYILGC